MRRRKFLSAGTAALGAVLAGCTGMLQSEPSNEDDEPHSDPDGSDPNQNDPGGDETDPGFEAPTTVQNGSFENDLDGWMIGKDLPVKPGDSSGKIDHGVKTVTRNASDGNASTQFYLDGSADDGTIWVAQTVDLSDANSVLFDVHSEQKSFNILTEVAFYAGPKASDELVETDFDRSNDVENHSGWKTFRYDVSDVDGAATVAIGMNIIWETGVKRMYDNVRLETSE
ncbi:hypothetical protein [Natrinema halophilum]|uniref:hypothetical protein n=1 Tax=Natrinema halophilum TaxID=1699371 RepID=UPI001F3BF632|nr:hypothetical protein [Natrinema halophilum]UHQ96363.1 hypothetical protein HYG82_22190 [Natrinema halophilum]